MRIFCPFINSVCRSDCVFCRSSGLSIVNPTTSCVLANKLAVAKPDDFKTLGDFICQEIRKNRP